MAEEYTYIEQTDAVQADADLYNQAEAKGGDVEGDLTVSGKIEGRIDVFNIVGLAPVATSGDYADLTGRPTEFEGATASADGASGLVPKPAAGDQDKVLKGDGTWGTASTAAEAESVPWSGVTGKPSTLSGYGITDAKIASGTITLGSNTITPLTSASSLNATKLSGTASIDTTGNAGTATKLATSRTISLTGDVSGSASFDGSANASITATVADDSHNHVISNVTGLQMALNGKAEDSGVVHLAGAETVSGVKTHTEQVVVAVDGNLASGALRIEGDGQAYAVSIADTAVTKGTAPSGTRYCGINFFGSASGTSKNRLAMLEMSLTAANRSSACLRAYDCSSATAAGNASIGVYNQNGTVWTDAPTPPAGNNSTQIATTAFVTAAVSSASDERLKTPLVSVPDEILDAWEAVGWGQFKFLDAIAEKGQAARQHVGLIAQRVKAVFKERGLDACQYGILCLGEDGLWSVRYVEALAMEAVCQRRRADRLEARLAALEERLNG